MLKNPGDIILFPMCTINEDHIMMYLRYMVGQTELFVILLGQYLPYPPKQAIKLKFWKNEKSA